MLLIWLKDVVFILIILETLLKLGIVIRDGAIAIPNVLKEEAIEILKTYSKENKWDLR